MSGGRGDHLWVAGLGLLLTILFADILLFGNTLYFRDLLRDYYPARKIFHDLIRAGEFPFWNPLYSAGQPFAANPGYQVFYPPAWATLLLPDFDFGFRLEVILHYYIAAFGMFAFIRTCGLKASSSAVGAIAWSIGGLLASLSNLLPFLFSAAWLPLLFLFVRRFFREHRLRDFAWASIVLGLILLAGDQSMILQAGFLTMAIAISYGFRWRPIALGAAICGAALLIGLVQIVPALDLQRDTLRGEPLSAEKAMQWSMAPIRPLELLMPDLFGRLRANDQFYWAGRLHAPAELPLLLSLYPGLLITLLVIAGFISRVRGWQFTAIVGGVSFLVAIGSWGPVFPMIHALGLRTLRYPEKFWILGMFVLTAFGAFAFEEMDRIRPVLVRVAAVFGAIVVVASVFSRTSAYESWFTSLWRLGNRGQAAVEHSRSGWILISIIAVVIVAILIARGRLSERTFVAAILLLLVADLAPRTTGLVARISPDFARPPAIAAAISRDAERPRIVNRADWLWFRTDPPVIRPEAGPWLIRNSLLPRSQAAWGLGSVLEIDFNRTDLRQTHDFKSAAEDILRARPERQPLLLQQAAATHVIDPLPMNEWRGDSLDSMQPVSVSRVPSSRYYFADAIVETRSRGDFVRKMVASQPSMHAAFVAMRPFAPSAGEVVAVRERANSIELDVRTAGDALLVLSVTPHRYWRATLDGREVPLIGANLGFQAVRVPGGNHHFRMSYRNPVIIACGVISMLTAIALLACALGQPWRRTS